ncbi:YfjI family protein [Pseudomonas sp. B21-036]|uniref:YfjI family protein n=1 Tax=Pseudomonas sp. B21-036 TaxID=2895485 RepID=UPI002160E30D|nr:YfjI family protein [Pseudomonas sp. B21-036]
MCLKSIEIKGFQRFRGSQWTIEFESGEFGELVNVQAAASKAAANVLRMAGVMAVVEESTALEEVHIQRASTLMDYYLAENQRLTEQEPLNKLRAEADCLLRWLIKKNWPPFRLRDLTRNGPRFARKSTRYTFELLLQLVTHNWLNNAGDIFEMRHVPPQ